MEGVAILDSLAKVRWHVAMRTYGNDHATLIGLLVDWWITLNWDRHSALEGGPCIRDEQGEANQCDALLCKNGVAVGVVEVEGTRHELTARKFDTYFGSRHADVSNLRFGLFLLYRSGPQGRGESRAFAPAVPENTRKAVISVSAAHPSKDIVVIALEKIYKSARAGIRRRHSYYSGVVSEIRAFLYRDGTLLDELKYNVRTDPALWVGLRIRKTDSRGEA